MIRTNGPNTNITITHKYPLHKGALSLPNSPSLVYNRLQDCNKYSTITTNKSLLSNVDSHFSPFYYDFTPDESYYSNSKTSSLNKKPIYNTADELNKYSSLERVLDRSPLVTAHSRIYQPHDIYNSNNSVKNQNKIRIVPRSVEKNNGTNNKKITMYRNTENIIYIPEDTSPNAFYKNHKGLLDNLNHDNKLFIYDDSERMVKYKDEQIINSNASTVKLNSAYLKQRSLDRNSLASLKVKDDDEIIYVPMKRSEFLKTGGILNTSEPSKITSEQNEYFVLKEKMIKKDFSSTFENKLRNENVPIAYIPNSETNQSSKKLENMSKEKPNANKTKVNSIETQKNYNIPIKIEIDTESNQKQSKQNMLLDPIFHKRYQITPTNNQQITDKVNNTQIQKENSSKVIISSAHKNTKFKNPITGLFGFSKKTPKIY